MISYYTIQSSLIKILTPLISWNMSCVSSFIPIDILWNLLSQIIQTHKRVYKNQFPPLIASLTSVAKSLFQSLTPLGWSQKNNYSSNRTIYGIVRHTPHQKWNFAHKLIYSYFGNRQELNVGNKTLYTLLYICRIWGSILRTKYSNFIIEKLQETEILCHL